VVALTTTTTATGYYIFPNLLPGVYEVSYGNSYTGLQASVANTGTINLVPVGVVRDDMHIDAISL